MPYKHININELVFIEHYNQKNWAVSKIAKHLNRSRETIYRVIRKLKQKQTALNIYENYRKNKRRSGRKLIELSKPEQDYIKEKIELGWTPDVIIGRQESVLNLSAKTLYRRFETGLFDVKQLPMKGKRKKNGHQEKRGKIDFKFGLNERKQMYPDYANEFGHLEGDTIVGAHHKSAVITLVERLSKLIITLKPAGRKAANVSEKLNEWFSGFDRHLFKSITFDCGKEFSGWKEVCNQQDIHIYFADPGTPSQRALNENSNGLLRRDGLVKQMDFNEVSQEFVTSVAMKRNHIPRKSLHYRTPVEYFMMCIRSRCLA